MKMKNILLSAVAASTLFAFGSQTNNASAKSLIVPKSYRGTWYQYDKSNKKFDKIKVTKNTATLEYYNGQKATIKANMDGRHSNYFSFGVSKDFTDGLGIWTKKMKINGHYKKVLVTYERMGYYSIFTKQQVKHDYSYSKNGAVEYGK